VISAEEVAQVTIFSALSQADREKLARAAADITLQPGEYAAFQGAERALFGLLQGRIEAVRSVDGVERVVGERAPGDIFGEVPITLGTVFPVGFRAAQPSRVMRLGPNDYYSVLAQAPEVGQEVGKLAAHRMSGPGGLQGLASQPTRPRAFVVGRRLDAACTELRQFLDHNRI
jgi:thioredoxin reductase (NADPH)